MKIKVKESLIRSEGHNGLFIKSFVNKKVKEKTKGKKKKKKIFSSSWWASRQAPLLSRIFSTVAISLSHTDKLPPSSHFGHKARRQWCNSPMPRPSFDDPPCECWRCLNHLHRRSSQLLDAGFVALLQTAKCVLPTSFIWFESCLFIIILLTTLIPANSWILEFWAKPKWGSV